MKQGILTSTTSVVLVAVAMLTITLPAMATHNSLGADVTLTTATEVGDDGQLAPDIPHPDHPNVDDTADPNPYIQSYHHELDEPRPSPVDQTGDRYTSCTTFGEAGDLYDPSNDDNHCYVGYLDHRWMVWAGHVLLTMQGSDALYPANPAPDDERCLGQEETNEHTGVGPVDELATRAERAATAEECQGGGHPQAIPGAVTIDVNLLAAPADGSDEGAQTPGLADATRADSASGAQPFPTIVTPYYFLFGQPHEDNENPAPFEAGSGPFGSNPAEGGHPLHDMEGVCGDRTQECALLTPEDLKLYDPYQELFVEDEEDQTEQARFCSFSPQFTILNPDERDAGLCGVNGDVVNQYTEDIEMGGLGVEEGPPTWLGNLPGWYQGVLSATQTGEVGVRGGGGLADFASGAIGSDVTVETAAAAASQSGDGMRSGVDHYSAVNPLVPHQADHPLWCVAPNMLTDDGGVYGDYVADAIDVDIFVSPFHDQYQTVIDASEDNGIPETTPDEVHVENAFDTLDEQEQFTRDQLPAEVQDAVDRAEYREASNDANVVDLSEEYAFEMTREEGLSCNHLGLLEDLEEEQTVQGGLAFSTGVSHSMDSVCVAPIGIPTGVCTEERALKDPTLLDEDGLPVPESQTDRGAWQPDSYGFGGTITAFLDTSELSEGQGDEFNGCAPATGAASPEDDRCVWRALWDAYNPNCTDISGNVTCGEILENRGYDTDEGVGLYAVLEITGPVATYTTSDNPDHHDDRDAVLGSGDPTATNCIVALSYDFREKLETLLDTDNLVEELCDVDGEAHLIEFGFGTQSAVSPGTFGSAFSFAKLLPTPDAAETGQDDSVCVTGLWSVADNVDGGVTSDTDGNLDLGPGQHSWSDCFELQPN